VRLASTIAAACLAAACVTETVSMMPGTRSFTADDYEDVYDTWTREASPFEFATLRSVLHVTTTFEAREFRWAYTVRYSRDFGLSTDARNSMLGATLADAERHHRFFITLGGGQPREMDLTSDRGAWRVLLLDDRGRQSRPVEIKKVDKPTPAERVYFPSISPFRTAFRLVFPVMHEDGYPTIPKEALFAVLRFTGPEGLVDLKWDFAHP
jgi:hypothetical protein